MIRRLRTVVLSCLLFGSSFACSALPEDEATMEDESEIVDLDQGDVERQTIGNCWLYAHASWAESMHKTATGDAFDVSQSYWIYWYWFDQIADRGAGALATGGNWQIANDLVAKYGLVAEKDFVAEDATGESANVQHTALEALNRSLKSGVLADPAARRDRKLVRAEMDRAFGLTPAVSTMLSNAFGESVTRSFTSSTPSSEGTKILRAQDFAVSYATAPGRAAERKTLAVAAVEWKKADYKSRDRGLQIRIQQALHARAPVLASWFVDFNALETRDGPLLGTFNMRTLRERGPGGQGGHMTVFEDYEAKLSDGTVLEAGVTLPPGDPRLDKALKRSTDVVFFRVKNSWGTVRPAGASAPGMPGYHDLHLDYLNGPVKKCAVRPNGTIDTSDCSKVRPLAYVILPPGF